MTSDGASTYGYDADDRLTTAPGGATLDYDAVGRLFEVDASALAATRFLYDGANLIAEYDASGNLQRRYVHGAGIDEPLVWYEGTDMSDRRWLTADERGSVIAATNASGSLTAVYTYDEYGIPGEGNEGRFQYTGQKWIEAIGLYDYKSRFYAPNHGRFLQTDRIGYSGGLNLYAYVVGDPVNLIDPFGMDPPECSPPDCEEITVAGSRPKRELRPVFWGGGPGYGAGGAPFAFGGGFGQGGLNAEEETAEEESEEEVAAAGGKEHTKNARPSTKDKHEKGQKRLKSEKGDLRRGKPRKRPPNWKGPWPKPPLFMPLIIWQLFQEMCAAGQTAACGPGSTPPPRPIA
jgi:RHS repeat-associated protein